MNSLTGYRSCFFNCLCDYFDMKLALKDFGNGHLPRSTT